MTELFTFDEFEGNDHVAIRTMDRWVLVKRPKYPTAKCRICGEKYRSIEKTGFAMGNGLCGYCKYQVEYGDVQ